MLRVAIPLALLVAGGLAARLTSQETPETQESREEVVEEAVDGVGVELIVEEEIKRQVGHGRSVSAAATPGVVAQVEVEVAGEAPTSSSPDAAASAATAAPALEGQAIGKIRIYPLKHIRAASAAGVIERLFTEDIGAVVPEERTNQLIVRAGPQVHQEIVGFLEALDRPGDGPSQAAAATVISKPAPSPRATNSADAFELREKRKARADDVLRMHPDEGPVQVPLTPGHPPQEHDVLIFKRPGKGLAPHVELLLVDDHHELAILAERIRGLRAASPPDEKALAELEEQLRDRVSAAFDARQEAQRAELAVLEQQLASIKEAIEKRDAEKDELVKQRVEQWLSGEAMRQRFEFRNLMKLPGPGPSRPPAPPRTPPAPPLTP